ncbi:MAG: hypothetical protein GC178_07080 [Flavobacteriales bacterium]|nr:hypothetical protein [Flavobacteriales bacterium]
MKSTTSATLRTATIVLLILTFFGCNDKTAEPIDPAFAGYISAFTSGVVSNSSTIQIRLAETHPDAKVNTRIEKELFDFSPNVEGEAYWIDSHTIEFRPKERLKSGKAYDVDFDLYKLVEVPEKLRTLTFHIQVMKQSMSVGFDGMEAYDNDLKWQMMRGYVSTYDVAFAENVEASLVALQNGKELKLSWEHEGGGKMHRFIIDSISRTEDRGQVILQWNGKELGFDGAEERSYDIPPLGEFTVLDVKTTTQPEQMITIFFSDPVSTDIDLNGLIYLRPQSDVRLVLDGNSVKLYPEKRLMGDVTLIVTDGVRNSLNYQLMNQYQRNVKFTSIKPAVELIGKGVILPSSDGLTLPFKAVNLKAVNVRVLRIFENNMAQFFQTNQFDGTREMKRVARPVFNGEVELTSEKPIDYGSWNNFSIDLSKLINAEPGALYRVQLSFKKDQSLYPCESTDDQELEEWKDADYESEFDNPSYWGYWDDEDYYDYDEYNYKDQDNPCTSSYYMRGNRFPARNLLASDIGIIAKSGRGTDMLVAVTDLRTTDPLSNVQVEIYNYQQQLVGNSTTDGDGFVKIDLKRKPYLLVAKKDGQRGYLRLDDGSALSLSMFDIGGQRNPKGVKGYIYGERGVWRPGDSLYLTFILQDLNKLLPKDHPVVFELYTPQQQLFERKVRTTSVNGFYDFRTATAQDAPTGNWLVKVKVGGSEFTRTVKIETIKPNRLKIKLDFGSDVLTNAGKPKGTMEVKWLHGAIADNLKTDVEMHLSEGSTSFKKYPDYVFDDPAKDFDAEDKIVFDGKLDAEGKATIQPDIQVGKNAPGMLTASFKTRAFEQGGDFSVDRFSIPYSPYRGYVGLKIPEGKGWNGAMYSNEPNLIPIITVDEFGKPVDRKGVKIEVFDVYWRWWWERSDENDLARYVSNYNRRLDKSATIDTKDGKAVYELNFGERTYGRKFIRVTDPVTGHSAGATFYVTYKGWWNDDSGNSPGAAELLTFSTDKKSYEVGETVKVTVPSSKQGRILASIESGSNIVDAFWVDLKKGENTFDVKTTKEMAPNVFIHLSLIQPHKNVKNDLPIRLYGVQPVAIENPQSHLDPIISMPKELAPEAPYEVKVKEGMGRKMTYTLAVVDEGLLDLTRFRTPDPWSHFYAKEALSVKTWDMYQYVIGAFSGEMAGLLALGGDEYNRKNGGAKANRFKPVVQFIGPFVVEAGKENVHRLNMANYVGSVRAMVVAGQDGAYGSSEKAVPVKKPLMVLATVPRVVGPNEKVDIPVTVFAMDEKVKNVTVSIEANELFHINGENSKTMKFARVGDEVVTFNLSVAEKLGIGKLKVIAKAGSERAEYEVELDVRTPNPRITDVKDAIIEPGQSWDVDYLPVGMAGTNNGVVEVSNIPSMNLESRLQYLVRYPHGCIEQTTSSVFPQLFLSNLMDLSPEQKQEIESNIKAGINRLRGFQIYSGGLSYWPGEMDEASDWGTNYAGHFMLEAKAKGYDMPPGFIDNWVKFQQQRANSWTNDMSGEHNHYYSTNQLIQAYRLYTLALAGKPALGAMNRMRSIKNLETAARWRLAAAYMLMGKKSIAEGLVAGHSTEVASYRELHYSYGSSERDRAMILETLTLLDRPTDAKKILDELTDKLSSNSWYSTQTTAYSLLAISKFVGSDGVGNPLKFSYALNNGKPRSRDVVAAMSQVGLPIDGTEGGHFSITNKGKSKLFIKMVMDGIPAAGDMTNAERDLLMKVRYTDLDFKDIDPSRLEQGTDLIAEVTITHPGMRGNYNELALTQIFPSGWEIRNLRMEEGENTKMADTPEYQDIRDDRVYSYFDLRKNESKTFRVLLNATYLGEFYLPTVSCEAMYDNEIHAHKAGKWVKVVEAGGATSQAK